jgi:hypothetical protein
MDLPREILIDRQATTDLGIGEIPQPGVKDDLRMGHVLQGVTLLRGL